MYGRPTIKVHGSVERLTQVLGIAEQDFLIGAPTTVTGGGSVDIRCDFTKDPITCEPEP
jgi:hypothetical protein